MKATKAGGGLISGIWLLRCYASYGHSSGARSSVVQLYTYYCHSLTQPLILHGEARVCWFVVLLFHSVTLAKPLCGRYTCRYTQQSIQASCKVDLCCMSLQALRAVLQSLRKEPLCHLGQLLLYCQEHIRQTLGFLRS